MIRINFSIKSLLNYIPGFRGKRKWKMIIASIYYAFSLLMLFGGFGYFLFVISIPFMIFNVVDLFKRKSKISALIMVLAIVVMGIGIGISPTPDKTQPVTNKKVVVNANTKNKKEDVKKTNTVTVNNNVHSKNVSSVADVADVRGELKISYINVGQADSILIQQGNNSMLIDAGNNGDSVTVKKYISSQGISKLDYVVGTHPHEDHIGGLDHVINSFQTGKIYMPKAISSTKTFKDVVVAIKNKKMNATVPVPGETFKLGEANCMILGPVNSNSEDLNTYSIVIKITFGNNKFLFTGDAQESNEEDMINKGYDLTADVLKVGHHGSHTSTYENFLNKVNPKYAVISVGEGNSYGHPHKGTMERLQGKEIKVYRTDECGTIVCTSDGKNISFNVNPGDYKYNGNGSDTNSSGAPTSKLTPSKTSVPAETLSSGDNNTVVYKTKTGSCYHMDGCKKLSKSKIKTTLKDAKAANLKPCNNCHPPQ